MNRGGKPVHAVRRKAQGAVCGVDEEVDVGSSRELRKMVNLLMPSQQEVDAHELTHLPFRSWCSHCMRGRGKDMPHRRGAVDEALELNEFCWGPKEVGSQLCSDDPRRDYMENPDPKKQGITAPQGGG